MVWAFYFLTTFYFCIVEPRVKLFEMPVIRWINNAIIISTCAFTAFLFLSYVPSYIEGISALQQYLLVGLIVLMAVFSSTDIRYVKILSLGSSALFLMLILAMLLDSGASMQGYLGSMANIAGYFSNLHRFVSPISDYHGWYLFWWFAWSIMIGQFVSRFVSGLKTWQLMMALLVIPSIAISLWFSVLYYYFSNEIEVAGILRTAMVALGTIFVINSLDSLIRLYTDNLSMTVNQLGRRKYILGNWLLMGILVLLYQLTPLKIEWVGLLVIGLYGVIYTLLFRRRELLGKIFSQPSQRT